MRRPNNRKRFVKREEKELHRINEKITIREVRLVMEGQEPQVMTTEAAIKLADDQGLDLVEISPKADPPVCKILDYKKPHQFYHEDFPRNPESQHTPLEQVV